MTEFFIDFGLFFLKSVTVVAAIVAVIFAIVATSRGEGKLHGLNIEKLNDKYRKMAETLRHKMLSKSDWRKFEKQEKKDRKQEEKEAGDESRKRVFVLKFKGDMRASEVDSLREEVTAVTAVATNDDEIVVCLENSGGTVHEHGLGASQLERIRSRGLCLTVIVDKVAASGGYLMASIANKIIAAPFAIIGSIGVLAQLPNFNRFLEQRGIDFEQVTAGKYKRTLTMFGKNTEEDRKKTREDVEEVHRLFKGAVAQHRPDLDMETVSTGEYWYGSRALELGLVDELGSSDDYLMKAAEDADIYAVTYKGRESLVQKIQHALTSFAASLGLTNDLR
ncbi:MAG: protease SohB [Gammaproteobacteria bacterium]|jgi:serine protease SohB|nr:protease SohB [Gammaproteobacteria bacterium]MDP6695931.1 protease SohB [Gammaproteobacteria bacterium]